MALTQKRLAGPAVLTTTLTTDQYTVPSSTTTVVKQVLLCNTTASAVTATIYCVPSGDSAGDSHKIVNALSLAANETVMMSMSLVMTAGDKIKAGASTGSAVNIVLNGVEEA
jgi:hypothetical protein